MWNTHRRVIYAIDRNWENAENGMRTSKNSPFGVWMNFSPHKCAIEKAQYTRYSVFSMTFSGAKSSAQITRKEF